MSSGKLPIILLLGAKSSKHPLAKIPEELSRLEILFSKHKYSKPKFELEHLPYFTQDQLKTKLDHLAGRIAVLHFAGHSDGKGLITDDEDDDKEVVYSHHIADHIRSWSQPPLFIFLNGCNNARQVRAFHSANVAVVIATHRAIDDGKAAEFSREFYDKLLINPLQTNLQAAFEQASANVLLNTNEQFRSPNLESLVSNEPSELDWGLYPQHDDQLNWVLNDLITRDRPVLDDEGDLRNPYKGLEAFQEEDKHWFFGRAKLIGELTESIPTTHFYTLMGASGSGKSSLINAGVVPRLREAGNYSILKCSPGAEPFKEIAKIFAHRFHPDSVSGRLSEQKAFTKDLQAQNIGIADLVEPLLAIEETTHVFLVVDQFEELFTQSSPPVIQSFIAQLIALLILPRTGCTLILIMRADFLAAALAYPEFAQLMDSSPHKLLSPMSEAELREAIEKPAEKQQVSLEASLTATLLDAVENQTGSLPLLQYVLNLLWGDRQEQTIRLKDYLAFGGLEKALESRANEIYQTFTETQRSHCQRVFIRLIQPGDGAEDTRRRAYLDEFTVDEREIITTLADARLITVYRQKKDEQAYAEVSHEALIRHWPLLQDWIEEKRDEWRLQLKISAEVKAWESGGRGTEWLLTGRRLEEAKEWLAQQRMQITNVDNTLADKFIYIEAGIREDNRVLQEKETQRQRELQLEEDKRKLAEQALEESQRFNRDLEEKNKLANYRLAKVFEEKLSVYFNDPDFFKKQDGNDQFDQLTLRRLFLYILSAAMQGVPAGKIGLDPEILGKGVFLSEQIMSGEQKVTPCSDIGFTVRTSPNGQFIASTMKGDRNVIYVWGIENGELLRTLKGHTRTVNSLAFSPDSTTIASGSDDNTVCLWGVGSGEVLRTLKGHTGIIEFLVFSPDGTTIASGSDDNTVCLWGVESGTLLRILRGHTGSVLSIGYSPDSRFIVSGSHDETIRLWDANSGEIFKTLQCQGRIATLVTYSPDGKFILSEFHHSSIQLWDVNSGEVLNEPRGSMHEIWHLINDEYSLNGLRRIEMLWGKSFAHFYSGCLGDSPIDEVVYSPDGSCFASGSIWHGIRIWDAISGELLRSFREHAGIVNSLDCSSVSGLAFSPDGKFIVSGSGDGNVYLWDVGSGKLLKGLSQHDSYVTSVAYSPDGNLIASGSDDKTVHLWDVGSGELSRALIGHKKYVTSVAFSPDGKFIASGSDDKTVHLWDVRNGELSRALIGHRECVTSLVYSPDGNCIASGSCDNTIRLWNAETDRCLEILEGHDKWITSVAFSPDGNCIASGSCDKTVRLWDVRSGKLLRVYQGHKESVNSVAYSPDGNSIISGSDDMTMRVWGVQSDSSDDFFSYLELKNLAIDVKNYGYIASNVYKASDREDISNDSIKFTALRGSNDRILSLVFTQDGRSVVAGAFDKVLRLWNIDGNNEISILKGHQDTVHVLEKSPDGKFIASGSLDKTIRIWEMGNSEPLRVFQCPGGIVSLTFSPDGDFIIVASIDCNLTLWRISDGKNNEISLGYLTFISAIACSPDSRFIALASNDDKTIHIWSIAKGDDFKVLQSHSGGVSTMAYSPDGRFFVSGSLDNTLCLWDTENYELLETFTGGHNDGILSIAYSPDGRFIASGGVDARVCIWGAVSGEILEILEEHTGPVSTVRYSPDGNFLASGSDDKIIYLWEFNESWGG